MTDPIQWQEFDSTALQRAQSTDRPVLLVLTVPWCQHCRDLLTTTFADGEVVTRVREHFVPILTDAERRPDVNDRYGTGGWPTIAFLTPTGDLIANDNWLSAQQLVPRLDRVRTFWREQKADIVRAIGELWSHKDARSDVRGRLSRQMVEDIGDAIYEKFDHRYGGWGEGAKFPHPEAIDFALVQVAKRNDERMAEVVKLTLDRMMDSPLHDPVDGGFFRFSKTADWRTPNFEKLLETNAKILRCYLEAYQLFGKEAYRRTAEGVVGWLLGFMADEATGAFFGSQDSVPDYYNLDREGRRRREPPAIDRTIHTNSNALVISNLLKAAAVLDQPEWRQRALRALDFLREHLHDGQDVFHYWDGTYHLAGMLSDQAYLIRALIDASQHCGDADLLLPAEAIAEQAMARQKAPSGGFYDILPDPRSTGSMRRRNRSILENSVMAEALVRLSYLSRRPEFHDVAIETLESFAHDYKEYGYYVASFGRAIDLIFYEPLVLTIVGNRDSAEAQALRQAALSTYVPSRIVQTLDPRHDPILMGRSGYKVEDQPVVHLTVGRTTRAAVRSPEQLLKTIEEVEWERRARLR